MAKGTVNKVILLGRIGINPEVRYMPSGMAVMSLSLATNDSYKDKQTGQFVKSTEWHRITVFAQQAETLGTYAQKGDLLYVEGRIKTTKYQDKTTGQDRYKTEIVATQTQMIGGKSEVGNTTLPDDEDTHISIEPPEEIPSDTKVKAKRKPAQKKPNLDEIKDEDLDFPPF